MIICYIFYHKSFLLKTPKFNIKIAVHYKPGNRQPAVNQLTDAIQLAARQLLATSQPPASC